MVPKSMRNIVQNGPKTPQNVKVERSPTNIKAFVENIKRMFQVSHNIEEYIQNGLKNSV